MQMPRLPACTDSVPGLPQEQACFFVIKSLGVEATQKQKGRVVVRKVGGFEVRTQQFFYGRDLCRAVAPEGSPEELHHTALKKASI